MAHAPRCLSPNTVSHILHQTPLHPEGHSGHKVKRAGNESREGGRAAEENYQHQREKGKEGGEGAI